MILNWIKKFWELLNKISPTNRNLLIILLMGYIFYSQISESTKQFITKQVEQSISKEKEAEEYTKNAALEINSLVRLIAEKDREAFDVLLLNYHNNTESLQGFKYLYLSCLAEAPKSLDTPLLKQLWNDIDYVYYADELIKIHTLSYVLILNIDKMANYLPKIYHLIKSSEAEAVSFYTIEGKDLPIGMVIILYKEGGIPIRPSQIMPYLLKLAILLDYDNREK